MFFVQESLIIKKNEVIIITAFLAEGVDFVNQVRVTVAVNFATTKFTLIHLSGMFKASK